MRMDPEALGLKKVSKNEPDPNKVEGEVEMSCPVCFTALVRLKPCCGARKGSYQCRRCGYKENMK